MARLYRSSSTQGHLRTSKQSYSVSGYEQQLYDQWYGAL